jgi:hypothetical protein
MQNGRGASILSRLLGYECQQSDLQTLAEAAVELAVIAAGQGMDRSQVLGRARATLTFRVRLRRAASMRLAMQGASSIHRYP